MTYMWHPSDAFYCLHGKQKVPVSLLCCRMALAFITEGFFSSIRDGHDVLNGCDLCNTPGSLHANTFLAQVLRRPKAHAFMCSSYTSMAMGGMQLSNRADLTYHRSMVGRRDMTAPATHHTIKLLTTSSASC